MKQCWILFPWPKPPSMDGSCSSTIGNTRVPLRANLAQTSNQNNPKWLVDSSASHHVTSDLQNLSVNFDYDGEDVMLGDGNFFAMKHFGSTFLPSRSRPSFLNNVLCVPQMKKECYFCL